MFRHKKNISFLTFILQVVVVKWFPFFTSSPSHFLLDIWNPGGGGELPYEKVRDARRKIWI